MKSVKSGILIVIEKRNQEIGKFLNQVKNLLILKGALQISENVTYNGNSRVYPAVIVRLVLRRRSMFYIVNFVFPCFILSLLCLFGYMLPVERFLYS
jgi:hypothetical protein